MGTIKEIISFIFFIKGEYGNTKNIFKKLYLRFKLSELKKKFKKLREHVLTKDLITEFIILYNDLPQYNINNDTLKVKTNITKYTYILYVSNDKFPLSILTSNTDDKIIISYNNQLNDRIVLHDSLMLNYNYIDTIAEKEIISLVNEIVVEIIIEFIKTVIKKAR